MYRNKFIKGKIQSFYEDKLNNKTFNLSFCRVHLIDVKENDEKVSIKIFAERPGILIGSRGSLVKELESDLMYHLLAQVEVSFKEFNPFKNEFKID